MCYNITIYDLALLICEGEQICQKETYMVQLLLHIDATQDVICAIVGRIPASRMKN